MASLFFTRSRRRTLIKSADRMAIRLQGVVEAIKHDYPSAASDVADAAIVIGRIAAALSEEESAE